MKKILVIDDDEGILDALEVVLESFGYKVTTSPNWLYLEKIKKPQLPNLILLDVLLSGKDGRDLCKDFKSKYPGVPVVMISAHPNAAQSVKSYGADGFIAKPFDIAVLKKEIEVHTRSGK